MPSFLSTDDADFEARFLALLGQKREEAEEEIKRFREEYDKEAAREIAR